MIKLSVTDVEGIERKIETRGQLLAILALMTPLAQMTPRQIEDRKNRYRFAPIRNLTGILDYTGTLRDL
jgi:hypothetical protein